MKQIRDATATLEPDVGIVSEMTDDGRIVLTLADRTRTRVELTRAETDELWRLLNR
jgi:hypothetical protein